MCREWKENTLFPLLQRIDPSDVFNADETGTYRRLMPNKTHAVSGETCTGGKKSKERITLLVCANMTGTEKLPLVAIARFKHSRCFRGFQTLPVDYDANKNSWMTASIFESWSRKWDSQCPSTCVWP